MFLESCVAVDFVECQNDSANFKQVWFALAAMAILLIPLCATVGEKEVAGEPKGTVDPRRQNKRSLEKEKRAAMTSQHTERINEIRNRNSIKFKWYKEWFMRGLFVL